MLDAAASGLPIIVNDTLVAVERVSGNGITYKLNDVDSLVNALLSLSDPIERKKLGSYGAEKMKEKFSWEVLVRRRWNDFKKSLNG